MKLKEEIEKLKPMSFKQRLGYIRDYYKWPLIGAVFALLLITGLAVSISGSRKETVLTCTWVNETKAVTDVEKVAEGFSSYFGVNAKKQRLLFDNGTYIEPGGKDSYTIASQSRLSVMWQEGDLDILIADEALTGELAQNGWFSDLESILPEDLFQALSPYLLSFVGEDGASHIYGIDTSFSSINPMEDGSVPGAHVLCIPTTSRRLHAVFSFLNYIFGL